MKQPAMSFLQWQRKFINDYACQRELARHRWSNGFICPRCGHDRAHVLHRRLLRQCAECRHQVSVTAGTLFEHTKLPLPKWFAAIYLMAADKGGLSALRLSKLIGVSWPTAQSMLRKLRHAMGDRDRAYWLSGLIEVDDAFVGGTRQGKAGRGAEGRTPVLLAVEHRDKGAGYLSAQVVEHVDHAHIRAFTQRMAPRSKLRSDALHAMSALGERHEHEGRITSKQQVDAWLPLVHIVIANLKRFLLGTFHGVSADYLQEYINEFVYRFNRRSWESQLPQRLLEAAVNHVPVPFRLRHV